MRNAMNIYKRKDGRFEGRIPIGYDENGKIKYRYLYSKNLSELKEIMIFFENTFSEHGTADSVTQMKKRNRKV